MKALIRYIGYISLASLLACMPNIEDDIGIQKPIVTNHNIQKINSTENDIVLVGTCPIGISKLMIAVDSEVFTETSKSTSRTLGEVSGDCEDGKFSVTYPVPNPDVSRTIKFKVRGVNIEGRQGEIEYYDVAYLKPSNLTPGHAIVSGGGLKIIGTNNGFVLQTVGQPVTTYRAPASSPGLVSGTTTKVRYGTIGILAQ